MVTGHPYRQSLNGPVHFLGGDRRAVLMLILAVVACVGSVQTITSAVVGVVLLMVGLPLLRRAYKADPLLFDLIVRSNRIPGFLPGFSTPFVKSSTLKRF